MLSGLWCKIQQPTHAREHMLENWSSFCRKGMDLQAAPDHQLLSLTWTHCACAFTFKWHSWPGCWWPHFHVCSAMAMYMWTLALMGPDKLALDLHIASNGNKVCGLLLSPVWPPGHCLHHESLTWQLLPGASRGQAGALGASVSWHMPASMGHTAWEADSAH